ncbi:MAG TPA: hypothetical protein VFO77_03500 [Actinoplanes sp.]|nr:hypothetical protein [Actinoplanes sp.]
MIRRTGAVVALAAALAVAAPAAPASAAVNQGPRPLVNAVQPVQAGQRTWVQVYWVSRRDVCDAQVTVVGDGVRVKYPANTESFTSFQRNATLAAGDYDYTAFRVTAKVPRKRATVVKLQVTISYTQLPRGTFGGGVDPETVPCTGKQLTRTSWVKLPVLTAR